MREIPFRGRRPPLVLTAIVLALATGCPPPPGPPPPTVTTVAVLPPGNRTGDVLLVAGGSLVEKYALRSARVTVPDLLEDEARAVLRERGVSVVPADVVAAALTPATAENVAAVVAALAKADVGGAALRLDVWRWEPETGTQPTSVIVGLEATLIDVTSGRTLWHWRPAAHPVPTPGAVTLGAAYDIATRAAVAEILEPWKHPEGGRP